MRWPWGTGQPAAESAPDDAAEAAEARRRAEQALREAKAQTGEIRAVRDRAVHHQRVNHFAELISETFWGGR
jgi:ElaB/YqjD/DUF883 family membrane-anchored ribosome-binding protein